MSQSNDGGMAFPQPMIELYRGSHEFSCEFGMGGMSLRDYFAAKIMPTVMDVWDRNMGDRAWDDNFEMMAAVAYEAADAMIAEREKEHG